MQLALVMYLTVTMCQTESPYHCKDIQLKNDNATLMSCMQQGQIEANKTLKLLGPGWKVKVWKCSSRKEISV